MSVARVPTGSRDAAIAALAAMQRGVVHRDQLLALGVHPSGIVRRVAAGRLHPLLPRVFAVGHVALPIGGRELAALLWRGPSSVLSHGSAAWLLGLHASAPTPVHVSSAAGRTAGRSGVVTHRCRRLDPGDVRERDGLRFTAPARTLLDLAETETVSDLERTVAEARVRRLVSARDLRGIVAKYPGRRGAQPLGALLDAEQEPTLTRSEAERAFIAVLRRAGLPMPRTNVRVRGFEVDALWANQRVIVEVDGYAFHRGRRAFEQDRRKAAVLESAGYRVLRVTWRQVTESPELVAALVSAAVNR